MKKPFPVRYGLINRIYCLLILITVVFGFSNNLVSQDHGNNPSDTLISAYDTGIESIGILSPFWRNHPVLGPHLQNELWLNEIPDYFYQTDFPYLKRAYDREVLFADHLSVVRLLGGTLSYPGLNISNDLGPDNKLDETDTVAIEKLSQYDFAYRLKEGTLAFRPEIIEQRLAPYIENGYESFTIVLDNIPYALTSHPVIGPYGQAASPDDPAEWYETVRQLCTKLSDLLGIEKANKLRFRIGTEMNGTARFAGTEDQFITHFDYAAAAIKDVLPGATLNVFNISSASLGNIKTDHNVNAFSVIEHATSGRNRKTGLPNTAVSFVAASRYYYEKDDLERIASGLDEVWDYAETQITGNNSFTREIQEYGALADWSIVPWSDNPDAFGNAMNLEVIIKLLSNGLDRLFLWNMLESVPSFQASSLYIPSSMLWGYSVLEYMQGGSAYILHPVCSDAAENTSFSALLSVFDNKAYLIVNGFNSDRTVHQDNEVLVKIPREIVPFEIGKITSSSMNNANSIYYNIRKDLDLAGNLMPDVKEKPEWVNLMRFMSKNNNAACNMAVNNWEDYISKWRASLTLTKFNGTLTEKQGDFYISLPLNAPESIVILLESN